MSYLRFLNECPICGSSTAIRRLKYRDRASGKNIDTGYEASLFWAALTLAVSILVLNVIIPSFDKNNFRVSEFVGILPVWAPVALALFVLVALEGRRVFRLESAVPVNVYSCKSCGHRWDDINSGKV